MTSTYGQRAATIEVNSIHKFVHTHTHTPVLHFEWGFMHCELVKAVELRRFKALDARIRTQTHKHHIVNVQIQ